MYSTQKNTTSNAPVPNKSATVGRYLRYPDTTGKRVAEGGMRIRGQYKHSLPELPLVSIITVCFNSVKTIEQTIQSVLGQTYDNIEYIIVDAASSDGTLDLIGKYEGAIDYFVSEPDAGLYDAMNKGLELASGEHILLLNSDDWYVQDCVATLVDALNYSGCDFVGALAQYVNEHGRPSHVLRSMPYDASCLLRMPLRHETMLVPARIYNEVGNYDLQYRIIADRQFVQRLFMGCYRYYEVPRPLLHFRTSGVSNNQREKLIQERERILLDSFDFMDRADVETLADTKFIPPADYESISRKYLEHPLFLRAMRAYYEDCKAHEFQEWKQHPIDWQACWKLARLPEISVILPVYNAEKTLARTLDSLLAQTFDDFEILCINDQTKDGSQKIIDSYCRRDARVKSHVNVENLGLGGTRNKGVDLSAGLYVFHIDPDDTLPDNALEVLRSCAIKYGSQLVKGAFARVDDFGEVKQVVLPCGFNKLVANTDLAGTRQLLHSTEGHWSILYDRNIAEVCRYPTNLKMGQDSFFLVNLFPRAKTVTLIPDVVYHYHANADSAMSTFNARKYLDDIEWRRRAWHILNDYGFKDIGDYLLQAYWHEPFIRSIPGRLGPDDQSGILLKLKAAFSEAGLVKLTIPPKSEFLRALFEKVLDGDMQGALQILNSDAASTGNEGKTSQTENPDLATRIAVLSSFARGGAGIAAIRLTKALQSMGVQANAFTVFGDEQPPLIRHVRIDQSFGDDANQINATVLWNERAIYPVQAEGCSARELFSTEASVSDWRDLKRIFQTSDVVHLHWVSGLLDYQNIEKYAGDTPIVWTLHDMNPFTGGCHYSEGCQEYKNECRACPLLEPGSELAHRTWKIKKKAYGEIKNLTVICPSEWLAKKARDSSLFAGRDVEIVPNFISLENFDLTNKLVARTQLGLPLDQKIILFGADNVSNKRKGGEVLVEAINALADRYGANDVSGLIFGTGNLSLNIKLHNTGHVADEKQLSLIYAAADVLAFPSLEDNAPQTVAESLLSGTPVVSFPVGFVPDVVQHKRTGYIARYLDVADFAEGLDWAINKISPQERIMQGIACRHFAAQYYDFHSIYRRHQEIYRTVIANRKTFF